MGSSSKKDSCPQTPGDHGIRPYGHKSSGESSAALLPCSLGASEAFAKIRSVAWKGREGISENSPEPGDRW